MGYNDVRSKDKNVQLGKKIYDDALYGRRGFRDDQLGIEETKLWREIFADIGKAARNWVNAE